MRNQSNHHNDIDWSDTQGSLAFKPLDSKNDEGNEKPHDDSSKKHGPVKSAKENGNTASATSSFEFYRQYRDYLPFLSEEEKGKILRNKNRSDEERNAVVLTVLDEALSSIRSVLESGAVADYDDDVQDKLLAVIERLKWYDPKGSKFSSFAHTVMNQQLSASIASKRPIPIPRNVSLSHHKVTVAKNEAINEGKTEEEIVHCTLNPNNDEAGRKRVKDYENAKPYLNHSFVSMQVEPEDSDEEIGTRIPDERADIPEDYLVYRSLAKKLMASTDLMEIETHVLTDFYALGYPMKKVAERWGIPTEDECRRIQQAALRKLRKTAKAMGIDGKTLFQHT